jgi:hypothetical protein
MDWTLGFAVKDRLIVDHPVLPVAHTHPDDNATDTDWSFGLQPARSTRWIASPHLVDPGSVRKALHVKQLSSMFDIMGGRC